MWISCSDTYHKHFTPDGTRWVCCLHQPIRTQPSSVAGRTSSRDKELWFRDTLLVDQNQDHGSWTSTCCTVFVWSPVCSGTWGTPTCSVSTCCSVLQEMEPPSTSCGVGGSIPCPSCQSCSCYRYYLVPALCCREHPVKPVKVRTHSWWFYQPVDPPQLNRTFEEPGPGSHRTSDTDVIYWG